MTLFYRVLGLVAAVNSVLGCITLRQIPLNWFVLALLALISAGGAELLANPQGNGMLESLQLPPILLLIAPIVVIGLFVICMMKRNLIFRPMTSGETDETRSIGQNEKSRKILAPRVSGWFQRGGSRLWLLAFPSHWDISDDGTVELVTGVDGGIAPPGLFYASDDPSGRWSLTLSRAKLSRDLDFGTVYFALSASPALRLPGAEKREDVVLSVRNRAEFVALLSTLEEIRAESTRMEASFATKLEAIAANAPAAPGPVQSGDKKPAGGEIAWDRLIDFSK
jgi:hypothetical protein